MPKKRPLDFIPPPVSAWRTALPFVGIFAVGLSVMAYTAVNKGHHAEGEPAEAEPDAVAAADTPVEPDAPAEADVAASEPAGAAGEAGAGEAGAGEAGAGEAGAGEAKAGEAGAGEAGAGEAEAGGAGAGEAEAGGAGASGGEAGGAKAESSGSAAKEPGAAEARPAPRPLPPLSPAEARLAQRAAAALKAPVAQGEVLAAREVFAAKDDAERTWDGAAEHCRALSIAGIQGWRLASRRELRSLDRGGAFRSGAFWASDRDRDDPDSAFAYDTKQGQSVNWLKQEPNARAVCVLPRPR